MGAHSRRSDVARRFVHLSLPLPVFQGHPLCKASIVSDGRVEIYVRILVAALVGLDMFAAETLHRCFGSHPYSHQSLQYFSCVATLRV